MKKTFLQSKLPPTTLLILAEQYLEWQRGYGFQIRDHQRGLLVSEWIRDTTFDRHRITLRVSDDPKGAILSAHLNREVFQNQTWNPLPSDGEQESLMLAGIEKYITESPAAQKALQKR